MLILIISSLVGTRIAMVSVYLLGITLIAKFFIEGILSQLLHSLCGIRTLNGMSIIFLEYLNRETPREGLLALREAPGGLRNFCDREVS